MFGQDNSNPKLQSLQEDLKRKKRLNVQGVWLPDEDTIATENLSKPNNLTSREVNKS